MTTESSSWAWEEDDSVEEGVAEWATSKTINRTTTATAARLTGHDAAGKETPRLPRQGSRESDE
jgi:hypothetical protein